MMVSRSVASIQSGGMDLGGVLLLPLRVPGSSVVRQW